MAQTSTPESPRPPDLWGDRAPNHFDLKIPCWLKAALLAALTVLSVYFLDKPIALWAQQHPLPQTGDGSRELMWLEQWGQGVCATVVVLAVALIDKAGRRRALSIAIACILTLLFTHLLKDLIGRSRPFIGLHDIPPWGINGGSRWAGPAMGFTGGAKWTSFPSAHTTGAFALATSLAWFYPRARALFMTLALITAAQRILHTAHYLSDTLAGLIVGITVARATLHHRLAGRLIRALPSPAKNWLLTDWQ